MSEVKYKSGEIAAVGDRVRYKIPNGSTCEGEVRQLPSPATSLFLVVRPDHADPMSTYTTNKVRPGGATKIG